MLSELLASLETLQVPEELDFRVLIIENDPGAHAKPIVDSLGKKIGAIPLAYVVEPTLGIAHARNRGIAEAISQDVDLLLFVDDDEVLSEDWLDCIYRTYCETGAKLVGGPVRPIVTAKNQGYWKRIVTAGITNRYREVEYRNRRRYFRGMHNRTTILTNNWLAETSLFAIHGLKFDDDLSISGGEDTEFFRDAVALGIATEWSPDAVVYENLTDDRLNLVHQFNRSVSQSATSTISKVNRSSGSVIEAIDLIGTPLIRLPILLLLVLSVPLTFGLTAFRCARASGWVFGRLIGLIGIRPRFYRTVTGH